MRLFFVLMIRLMHARRLTSSQVRGLIRLMRAYEGAWHSGNELPLPARWVTRPGVPLMVWAAWRVSVESPGLFMFGAIALVPAVPIFLFTIGRWIWRLVRPLVFVGA